jgi:hypothetical protein
MRFTLVSLVLLFGAFAPAQNGTNRSLFVTTRVDATAVIDRVKGVDMVEVTVLKPNYSPDLLRRQIARLGQELHFEPQGLGIGYVHLTTADPSSGMIRASFAVNGLIDSQSGALHVRPIARAFALASPTDKLDALMVQFKSARPSPQIIRACSPPEPGCSGVILEGRDNGPGLGIEYRLKFLTHDPDAVSLPDTPQDVPAVKAPEPVKPPATDGTLIALLLICAAAVGALVYSLLLRGRRPGSRPSGRPPGGASRGPRSGKAGSSNRNGSAQFSRHP